MEGENSKRTLPCYVVLLIITLAAGLILGGTYMLTKDAISERQLLDAEKTRQKVLSSASAFTELEGAEGLDWLYAGLSEDGSVVGYVGQVTVKGYKADIEVISGMDVNGRLTGISVGGSSFAETAGLGAKTKDADFTKRFIGLETPITVLKTGDTPADNNVDAITGATISSKAVAQAVNEFGEYVYTTYIAGSASEEGDAE